MKIEEVKNEKIKIEGAPNSNDTKLDVEPCLPSNNHFSLFIGAPGSGKTSLVISLLTSKKFRSYRGVFDKIFFFSGSLNTLPETFIKKLNEDRVFDTLEPLENILEELKKENEGKILIIIDDLVREIKTFEPLLKKLVYNRRHYSGGISIWMISQKLRAIPLSLRCASDAIFFFSNSAKNKTEAEALFEDYIVDLKRDQFYELLNYVFKNSKPYDFIYINKVCNTYFKNFNKLILDSN